MAHYAVLDRNNVVIEVFPGRDEDEIVNGISDWEEYYSEIKGKVVLRTSYNTWENTHRNPDTLDASDTPEKAFRGNYAGIGFIYDSVRDAFIPPKPEDTAEVVWSFDDGILGWVPTHIEA